jgi:hypothetical protein
MPTQLGAENCENRTPVDPPTSLREMDKHGAPFISAEQLSILTGKLQEGFSEEDLESNLGRNRRKKRQDPGIRKPINPSVAT